MDLSYESEREGPHQHECLLPQESQPCSCCQEIWCERPCICAIVTAIRHDERAATLKDSLIVVYEIQDDGESSTEWDRDYDVDPTGETRSPRIWLREAMAAIESLRSKH